jgi:hypothetical protein
MKRRQKVIPIARVAERPRAMWWNGDPMVVKLDDWAAFADANRLRAVRSRIEGEQATRLQVIVEVIRDVES